MQTTSALYNSIISGPHNYEVKFTINDGSSTVTYDNSHIYDITVQGDLFSGRIFGIGGASGRMTTMRLYNVGTVPQLAEIRLYVRAYNSTQTSEWLPKGVFYKSNKTNGEIDQYIEAYDVLAKSDNVFMKTGTWSSQSVYSVVASICTDIGCSLDSATISLLSSSSITIGSIPVIGANGTTCRELLKYIAVLFRGNWITDDSGYLCLKQAGTSTVNALGESYDSLTLGDAFNAVDRVILWTGDNQAYYAPAGLTDAQWNAMTGQIVECTSPYGTQSIATSLLSGFSGYAPRPLDAYKFQNVNMALELGDTISVTQGSNTYTTVLAYQDIALDSLCSSNLGFDVEDEVDNVFSSDTTEKKLGRKVAGFQSEIEVLDDRISLVVTGEGTSKAVNTAQILLAINDDGETSTLINADKVKISGTTTFDSLFTSGTTTIDGGKITAGSLSVTNAEIQSLNAGKLTVAGQTVGGASNQLTTLGAKNIYVTRASGEASTVGTIKMQQPTSSATSTTITEMDAEGITVTWGSAQTTSKSWLAIASGSGGEPSAYLKSASVSGNTLTLTNKDDTTVTFTPVATFG